jgi:hypothetical protein
VQTLTRVDTLALAPGFTSQDLPRKVRAPRQLSHACPEP